MEEERSLTWHYVLRAAVMAGFSFYVAHLAAADKLVYYIAPRMMPYVKLAALALFVIAVCQAFLAYRSVVGKTATCDCEHLPSRSLMRNTAVYGLLASPLLLGLLLPDVVMGSDLASVKGMNLSANAAVKQSASQPAQQSASQPAQQAGTPALGNAAQGANANIPGADSLAVQSMPSESAASDLQDAGANSQGIAAGPPAIPNEDAKLQEMFKADKFMEPYAKLAMKLYKHDQISITESGFMELLTSVDLYMDRFVGKKMEISGFVYREEGMKPEQFVVSRLAMQCCSADAAPYGVLVESSLAKNFPKDTWVKLSGTIDKTTYNDNEIMKIDAVKIEKIKASKTPYVYPYTEEFSTLGN
ncbi:TIGR03943 family putative permease subunit [Paenibacillus thalictri]|uniref:TIGR03943 family protein n=1 Tax=Paenibacillus thalictri TaxID=2527873 RepID=A0A4Q9DFK3_9BACL|nr:TIGR03943 family protein [Paenibacillus thalictri]TBL70827.1 TIGR03943 family protein [Paenibacillus thalictri]